MLGKRAAFKIIACTLTIFFLSCALAAAAGDEGVFYEIFVRSFYDSNSDGIGDINGLIEKLDYLNDGNPQTNKGLGIKGIWLMPILESPSYHGYDVTDYFKVKSDYGSESDFQQLVTEVHKRGIKVVMDLVLNHTSSSHPWFIDACRAKVSDKKDLPAGVLSKADWYTWKDAMPQGWTRSWGGGGPGDVWHRRNGFYYYGTFGAGMPDLNYKNEEVIEEMKKVIRYWLDKGIDGFRLDGVRYLVETKGGVLGQADTEETHRVLKILASYAKSINKNCMLIGEVWAGNDIAAGYYDKGNELTCAFNFDLAGAIINSIRSGDYKEIERVLNKMAACGAPADFYSPFLTNHDQNRIASELNEDDRKLKLAAALLLSMRGTPFIYYGEEIGMTGKKPDERIRTPMQWDDIVNGGFTKGKAWEKPQDNYNKVNVKSQEARADSLLNYYKRLIEIRNKYGKILYAERKLIKANNGKVYAYLYTDGKEGLLFIHNFEDKKAEDIKLNFSEAGFDNGRYKVTDLLDKITKMKDIAETDSEYRIGSLDGYESLILKISLYTLS